MSRHRDANPMRTRASPPDVRQKHAGAASFDSNPTGQSLAGHAILTYSSPSPSIPSTLTTSLFLSPLSGLTVLSTSLTVGAFCCQQTNPCTLCVRFYEFRKSASIKLEYGGRLYWCAKWCLITRPDIGRLGRCGTVLDGSAPGDFGGSENRARERRELAVQCQVQ